MDYHRISIIYNDTEYSLIKVIKGESSISLPEA